MAVNSVEMRNVPGLYVYFYFLPATTVKLQRQCVLVAIENKKQLLKLFSSGGEPESSRKLDGFTRFSIFSRIS